jgi:hypothetical protein
MQTPVVENLASNCSTNAGNNRKKDTHGVESWAKLSHLVTDRTNDESIESSTVGNRRHEKAIIP